MGGWWIRVGSKEAKRKGTGKSEKKQMMNMVIVKSVDMTRLGKTSSGKNAFPLVLVVPSSQHAAGSVELGH